MIRKFSIYVSIVSVSYFLIISCSQTKLVWYDIPLYPFLAFLVGISLLWFFNFLKNFETFSFSLRLNVIPYLFLFLVMIKPYRNIINETYKPKEDWWNTEFYQLCYFLQEAVREERKVDNLLLCFDENNTHLLFYMEILNSKGNKIDFADWHKLKASDNVIASQKEVKKYIENNYFYEITEKEKSIRIYKILNEKKNVVQQNI